MKYLIFSVLLAATLSADAVIKPNHFFYQSDSDYEVGTKAHTGDINQDGFQDIVMPTSNGLLLLFGDGEGNFMRNHISEDTEYYDVALSDINGDTYLDVVAVGNFLGGQVWLNDSKGNLVKSEVTLGDRFYGQLSSGDIDNDGDIDILLETGFVFHIQDISFLNPRSSLLLLRNNGSGEFSTIVELLGNYAVSDIVDMDGDGNMELVSVSIAYYDSSFSAGIITDVTYGKWNINENSISDGRLFTTVLNTPIPTNRTVFQPRNLNFIDWNNDGLLDIVSDIYDEQSNELLILVQQENFGLDEELLSIEKVRIAQTADVNNDGFVDLLGQTDAGFRILYGDNSNQYTDVEDLSFNPRHVVPMDFDNDGDLDIFATQSDNSVVAASFINTLIDNDFSGLWYDPNQLGHGLQIERIHRDSDDIFVSWYVANEGKPVWITGVGGIANGQASLEMIVTEGGNFPLDASRNRVNNIEWGTINFEFIDTDTLNISWDSLLPEYPAGTLGLKRLSTIREAHPERGKLNACHSGTWYNLNEDGHGFMVNYTGADEPSLVMTWFTYFEGDQYWLLAQGPINDNRAEMDVQIVNGDTFPSVNNSNNAVVEQWGSVSFELVDDDNAVISWNPLSSEFPAQSIEVIKLTNIDRYRCN